jgi:hypothetical protein
MVDVDEKGTIVYKVFGWALCGDPPELGGEPGDLPAWDEELWFLGTSVKPTSPPAETIKSVGDKPLAADPTPLPSQLLPPPPVGPFVPLTSWLEIFAALNEPIGKPHWKSTDTARNTIRTLNSKHNGPIIFPPGKGKQPSVNKSALMQWWKGLQEHFDARNEEAESEAESARSTVADTHNYGKSETVVPGINGSVKRARGKGNEKGKEGKR